MGLAKHSLAFPVCVFDDGSRHSKPVQLQDKVILIAKQNVVKVVLLIHRSKEIFACYRRFKRIFESAFYTTDSYNILWITSMVSLNYFFLGHNLKVLICQTYLTITATLSQCSIEPVLISGPLGHVSEYQYWCYF